VPQTQHKPSSGEIQALTPPRISFDEAVDRGWIEAASPTKARGGAARKPILAKAVEANGLLNAPRFADIQQEPIEWLWEPYIRRGVITVIAGDSDVGKSFITCRLAANVSTGDALPGQDATPLGNAMVINTEDDPARVLKVRLADAGADMSRVRSYDMPFPLSDENIALLEKAIRKFDLQLVTIDPLVAFLAGVDFHRANEMRERTAPLAAVAKRTNCAIVIVNHVTKTPGGRKKSKVLGSGDVSAVARSVLYAELHKDGSRTLEHIKHNYGEGQELTYSLSGNAVTFSLKGNDMERLAALLEEFPEASNAELAEKMGYDEPEGKGKSKAYRLRRKLPQASQPAPVARVA
jgi:RecA-family ATPase